MQATPDGTALYVSASGCGAILRQTLATGADTPVAGNGHTGTTTGDGGLAGAAGVSPTGIALDSAGDLFLTDTNRVRQVPVGADGVLGKANSSGQNVDTDDYINTVAGNGSTTFLGDGGPALKAAVTPVSDSMATDRAGNVYISDNKRVRFVCQKPATSTCSTPFGDVAGGNIATIAGDGTAGYAGDGGLATGAQISNVGIALDPNGNLLIANAGSPTSPSGVRFVCLTTMPCATPFGQVGSGGITTIAGGGVGGFSGDGGPATNAQVQPTALVTDSAGNLYIGDFTQSRVRFVCLQLTGPCTTPFGTGASGDITTIAGTGTPGDHGDGGPAVNAWVTPFDLALDSSGDLYLSPGFTVRSICVRMTLCHTNAGLVPPGYIAAIAGTGQDCVWSSTNACGDGGLATSASFHAVNEFALDSAGNLYLSDGAVVRFICMVASCPTYLSSTTALGQGYITTIAGTGTAGDTGDGHPANAASIEIQGLASDSGNDVFIGDGADNVVREVTAPVTLQPYISPLNPGFPLTALGSSSTQTVTLTNATSSSITVSSVAISGTNGSDFSFGGGGEHCSGTTVATGGTCTVQATFRPSASGPRTATMSFADSGGPTTTQTAGLVGQGAGPYFAFSPSPIAAPASLGAGATVTVTVTDYDATGNAVPNGSVYIAFAPTGGGGTASAGSVALSTTPQASTANSLGQVAVTYTAPSVLPTGGEDIISAQNAASGPTVTASDAYVFSKTATYKYSVSPIASTGTLGPRVTVKVVLTAKNGNGTAVATVYLSFTSSTSGGSARVGTKAITTTPTAFKASSKGTIIIAYTTPGTLPSTGTDTITATDATVNPSLTTSDHYTF